MEAVNVAASNSPSNPKPQCPTSYVPVASAVKSAAILAV
jgi:hypothetical protein